MIKVDMEMPESCIKCGWYKWSNFVQNDVCAINYHIIDFEGKQACFKSEKCPLIECEDEKSCETCKNLKVRKDYRMCDEYECDEYSKWQAK